MTEGAAPEPAPAGPTEPDAQASVTRFIERAAAVVAPVGVVTGLLAYVGWVFTSAYYGYFGVPRSVLGFSTQDYVFDSAVVTSGAVIRLLAAAAALLLLDRLLNRLVHRGVVGGHRVRRCVFVTGLALAAVGVAIAVGAGAGVSPLVGAALLGIGAVAAVRFGSPSGPADAQRSGTDLLKLAVLCLALAVALLWAATLYAQDLGRSAAAAAGSSASSLPVVVVYSSQYLDLPGSRVVPIVTTDPTGARAFRYIGPLLLNYANGRWLLITDTKPGYHPSVVILHDVDTIRVQIQTP
jgi:hypothetical protein